MSVERAISSVAVLGCGTMGSGIAAASAAAGCRVLMLDLTPEAVERGLAAVAEEHRHLVDTGTFDQDLKKIHGYDWVCEAIVEDLETKRAMFEWIEAARSPGSVVSSNTSGIPLRDITEGLSPSLRRDIAITHFFNPVQVMKLFELVPGADTSPEVVEAFVRFGTDKLHKGVVHAKDTVNFIGNRIGCFFMLAGLHRAKPYLAEGITQETIDAVLSTPVGLPATGLYGLIDLIGLDVMDLVGKNLAANLPAGDPGLPYTRFPVAEQAMLERGQLGRKAREVGGFSRVVKSTDGTKTKETFDLHSQEWRPPVAPAMAGVNQDLGEVLFEDSLQGRMAWDVFGGTLRYAAGLVPEIADDIANVDNAIRWGFNWQKGPFEMIDHVGPARMINRIEAEGGEVPLMLDILRNSNAETFYRESGPGRQMLMPNGEFQAVPQTE
ncbi:MAG: 3-hydroxyacyl-CoA dehydrogenase family protein [Acidimicrobiales bacterium]|nr:3-hydroxyacyl-CoA dehydrogenase family protein [Acidimicrobiales bacterium]